MYFLDVFFNYHLFVYLSIYLHIYSSIDLSMYSSRYLYNSVHITFGAAAKGLDSSVRSWRGSLPVLNTILEDHA